MKYLKIIVIILVLLLGGVVSKGFADWPHRPLHRRFTVPWEWEIIRLCSSHYEPIQGNLNIHKTITKFSSLIESIDQTPSDYDMKNKHHFGSLYR